MPGCWKAYVLRFNRNKISIIDTSQRTDAGVPIGTIDLSPLVVAGDNERVVEMTAAIYVPSKKRL